MRFFVAHVHGCPGYFMSCGPHTSSSQLTHDIFFMTCFRRSYVGCYNDNSSVVLTLPRSGPVPRVPPPILPTVLDMDMLRLGISSSFFLAHHNLFPNCYLLPLTVLLTHTKDVF